MLLQGRCRIAIHSAKDLPEPLPEGLALVAVTRGVDASDALVFRSGGGLAALPPGSRVGASSARREEAVLALRPDLRMVDIRGTIEKRLALLHERAIDALVVAEAALIRLGLTHLTRIALPGPTAPLQGQLAVVARSGDIDMERLFSLLDARCERKSSM